MKKLLLLFILLLSLSIYSQIQVNNVREGYYQVFGVDGIKLQNGNKETLAEALQGLTNYQLKTGLKGYYIPPTFRVDIIGEDRVMRETEIDTLTISGHWHITGDNGNYFRYINAGDIIKIETDSVMKWQRDIEIIRTKTFGETEYFLTDKIPFQFMKLDSICEQNSNSVKVRTFATEFHGVKYYVDNVLEFDFSDLSVANPGNAIINNQSVRRHSHEVKGLDPNTTYLLRVEGNTEDGRVNFTEYYIKTL